MSQLRLDLSQRQGLVMSPMMQQAVALLVMSTLELNQHIEQELETNPTLEMVEPDEDEAAPAEGDAPIEASESPEAAAPTESSITPEAPEAAPEQPGAESELAPGEIDYENLFSSHGSDFSGGSASAAENVIEETASNGLLLPEYLENQLVLAERDPEVDRAARQIISKLDFDGYTGLSADEFASANGLDPIAVRNAVDLIQSFDPPGVGAIDVRESLLIQLERRGERDTSAYRIVERHLDDLARNRLPTIARDMGLEVSEVIAAADIVRTLDPHPGRGFSGDETSYVVPDVIVEKIDGVYLVTLRDDRVPRVRVNDYYLRMFKKEKRNKNEVSQYLKEKLDSAVLLIKSIEKRQNTIYRVAESIVRHQIDFLEYGPKYLRPMTLKVVADDLGVHESTVSRVTTQKYMQTPQGTFEMKYFFTSSIEMMDGEDASARSVRTIIKEIIVGEDGLHPISDQRISEMLATRGFKIARRTVTKYREQIGILPAKQRTKWA